MLPPPPITDYQDLGSDFALTEAITRAYPAADTVPCCTAMATTHPYQCTRPRGHAGPHVAHDLTGAFAIWPAEAGA